MQEQEQDRWTWAVGLGSWVIGEENPFFGPVNRGHEGQHGMRLATKQAKTVFKFQCNYLLLPRAKNRRFREFLRLSSSPSAFLPLQTELVPHEAFAKIEERRKFQPIAHVLVLVLLGVEVVV